jgi:hypothetical protein
MINSIKESDWKYLKKLKPILLERACAKINKEAELKLKNKQNQEQYQVFMALYKHYHKKDKLIADCFDDYRRSTAIYKILHLLYNKIITDDEFEGFSSETKEIVEKIKEINDRT